MKLSRTYFNFGLIMCVILMVSVMLGYMIPSIEVGLAIAEKWITKFTVVFFSLSLVSYLHYLLFRKKVHLYRCEWAYYPNNKYNQSEILFKGATSFRAKELCVRDRDFMESMHKWIYAQHKPLLCNGFMRPTKVSYCGYKYEY
jgi:hypothetical protein